MTNRQALEQELLEINKTLEDHLMIQEMDRAMGYVPPLTPEEQEYLFEICRRKHEIENLIGADTNGK